jgi:hypothetical protein
MKAAIAATAAMSRPTATAPNFTGRDDMSLLTR